MAHCQIANQQQTMQQQTMQQKTAQQAVYRHTPHHAAQPLSAVLNAPRKPIRVMHLDLAPVCSAAVFAAEIEGAQDPVTPLHVMRTEPPKLNKRR
jgi:hypothetical protein